MKASRPFCGRKRELSWTRRAGLSFFLLFCLPPQIRAQVPYVNPVVGDPQHAERELPDPFVLKWNREYFLYTSGSPIIAYHSTNLVHWDLVGPVLYAAEGPEAWNQADVWAPEVVYRNGTFYLYYTQTRYCSGGTYGSV